MKKIIGVMGAGHELATKEDLEWAYEIGKIIGATEAVLLCGGMSGTMEACAKGAQEAGGLTVGIGPTREKQEMNRYIDIPLLTGMHAGRNYMNVLSSDILIFVGIKSPGTLSELAFAIQLEKPMLMVQYTDTLKTYLEELASKKIIFIDNLEDLKQHLAKLLESKT